MDCGVESSGVLGYFTPFVTCLGPNVFRGFLGGGFEDFLFSTRTLGKIPILTHIFQMG